MTMQYLWYKLNCGYFAFAVAAAVSFVLCCVVLCPSIKVRAQT